MKLPAISSFLVPASALFLAGIAVPRADHRALDAGAPAAERAAVTEAGAEAAAAPLAPPAPLTLDPVALDAGAVVIALDEPEPAPLDLGAMRLDPALGRYVAPLGEGQAILTIDPQLQARLERTLRSYAVPEGVTVLMEPATGRVLALAEHAHGDPGRRGLSVEALAPAASIFKIVTAAALLEQGVRPDDEICYHGGKRRLQPRLLADDPRRDRRCLSLEAAFGHSTNVVFAKLADRGLDAPLLRATAERFLFNRALPFPGEAEVSTAEIADGGFELANTAAGFGPVRLSPLHGALLAAIIANEGVLVPPLLVEEAVGVDAPVPPLPSRVVDEEVAAALAGMMRSTCTEGTARKFFRRGAGPRRGVTVAGKTGSLADRSPFRDYSWFVGYAPADKPQVAVGAVIVNDPRWRIRATYLGREALRIGLGRQQAKQALDAAATTAAP